MLCPSGTVLKVFGLVQGRPRIGCSRDGQAGCWRRCWAWGGSLDGTRCPGQSVGVPHDRRGSIDRESARRGSTGRVDGFENGTTCRRLISGVRVCSSRLLGQSSARQEGVPWRDARAGARSRSQSRSRSRPQGRPDRVGVRRRAGRVARA